MKKYFKITGIVLAWLIVIAITVVAVFNIYFYVSVPDFYKRANAEGKIPGLKDGFIPQGLSYVPEENIFLTCGYMNDDSASRIYMYDDSDVSYVTLSDAYGDADANHAGGLSYWDGFVFLAHGNTIAVYDFNELKTAAAQYKSIAPESVFDVGFGAAFCHVEGDTLYVGEFYRDVVYPTPENHHMMTDSGDSHHAILCAYDLMQIKASGFSDAEPLYAYSILDQAQGVCFDSNGNICISTSWGLSFSHIHVYENPATLNKDREIEIGDAAVPLYYLDYAHERKDITLIPMCEELYCKDGRIFFTNESASSKYIFGKLTGGEKIFSLPVD